jgi:hypothetical protein
MSERVAPWALAAVAGSVSTGSPAMPEWEICCRAEELRNSSPSAGREAVKEAGSDEERSELGTVGDAL